jgi:amidohydrolase
LDIEWLKSSVISKVDSYSKQLIQLSLRIHSNPETSLQEVNAANWLTQFLAKSGFTVEYDFCKIPTAFKASYGNGEPAIAFLAEYDALPELGHACGHNLIATSAVGAGIAAKLAVKHFGGSIIVIGTPGEESGGSKVKMVASGGFKDINIAMMVHPGIIDYATTEAFACIGLKVEFFGKPSHAASSPEAGINALEAMLISFNAINSLRQHISKARIHGIITYGGEVVNVIPDYSAATFLIRAEEDDYLYELQRRTIDCFTGAAIATGACLKYKWADVRYAPMLNNITLARVFSQNMKSLGRKIQLSKSGVLLGSTDMGNVSQVVPSIHSFIAIAHPGILIHTPEFAAAEASKEGNRGLLDAAKSMAMTAIDLLSDPGILIRINKEFNRNR